MICKGFGLCGIIWDHLKSFGFSWGSSGSTLDHVESSAIIWDHMFPSRLARDRLGSSWIIWHHLRIHLESPGGTIWEETSEERHLESIWEGTSQLMRKHHFATVCKTDTTIAISLSVSGGKSHQVLYMVGIGSESKPKVHEVLRQCMQNESETCSLRGSGMVHRHKVAPLSSRFQHYHQNVNVTTCFAGGLTKYCKLQ